MSRYKEPAKKSRLAKKMDQTSWAPFWTVPKIYGKRKVHPGRHTTIKRRWRRGSKTSA